MNTCTHTPVIGITDIVILGGGLAAFTAALSLSEAHYRVLMIVKETYMLEDLCLPHFYNCRNAKEHHPLIDRILNGDVQCPDQLKLRAEGMLNKTGIEYLYAAMPLDLHDDRDGMKYLRIAGKFGINAVKCRKVIDLRSTGEIPDRLLVNAMNGPELHEESNVTVTSEKGDTYAVVIRPGTFDQGHVILDIPVEDLPTANGFESLSTEQGKRVLESFGWIRRNKYEGLELGRFAAKGYSSKYSIDDEIQRGLLAASDLSQNAYCGIEKAAPLLEELELISYNELTQTNVYDTYQGPEPIINSLKKCDVAVVGGGTAGAMAAIYAARQGAKTILIELNEKLGGTGTVGGVSSYWFGKRHKETIELGKRINGYYEKSGQEIKPGIWSDFDNYNPDLKAYALAEMCEEAGVEVVCQSVSFAAIGEKGSEKRVRGIAAVTPNGMLAVHSRYVIDATGDGDIAAFASAGFTYGSGRDSVTFWASLAQYTSPKDYKNNFSSTVMVSDAWDYTRFITAGRRRGDSVYDHGTYVAPRESRHIKGLYTVTLNDAVTFKEYEDTIYTCFSNYDPKGKLNADMVYAGVLPPQNSTAVPLRAIIPVGRDNHAIKGLLIAGKAFSCTHNAFPGMRMQPDLQHQGAVIGLIASEAVSAGLDPFELNIKELQEKIRTLTGDSLKLTYGKRKSLNKLVSSLQKDIRLEWTDFPFEQEVTELPDSIAALTAPSTRILPLLEKLFAGEKDKKQRLMLARFILWHGSDFATDTLLKDIMEDLGKQEELPERKGSLMCVQLLPDHGVMAETVYKLNLLAWSKRTDIFKPFEDVLEKLIKQARDYRDNKKSIYHYVESLAYVAEHTCLPEFKPMLKELLLLPEFAVNKDISSTDILLERHVILKLSLCRALARCGDIAGYALLVDLLKNPCASIRSSAYRELLLLTGKRFKGKPEVWFNYIHSQKFTPIVKPITKKVW